MGVAKAMIFAGDIPQGHRAQLMRGNMDRLFEGAADAATSETPYGESTSDSGGQGIRTLNRLPGT